MKYILLLLSLIAWTPSWASEAKLTDWMQSYYLTKDDSRVSEFWDRTVTRGGLKLGPQMREKLIGFFGAVFRQNPDLLRASIKSIPKEAGVEQDGIVLILWLADQDYSRGLLRDAGFAKVADTSIPPIQNRQIEREEDADFLESWYNATGNIEALMPMVRLIKETDWAQKNPKADYTGAMVAEICRRDVKARIYIRVLVEQKDLTKDARAVLEHALSAEPKA
ncbi:hypothetical protein CMV30_00995 [Nibricoccus aquaticus]|uniref:Uncharacterized protein n=1 Tax=Nibricoccus aquaticus TaxID=2576891 RepID=A0A290Q2Y3_9BACT|nr:hypothetical protein [Nibricoccus aquaticus]ATC62657.1 hypothetical protein CMV30_00995 [Nibricoccus aquaticus]